MIRSAHSQDPPVIPPPHPRTRTHAKKTTHAHTLSIPRGKTACLGLAIHALSPHCGGAPGSVTDTHNIRCVDGSHQKRHRSSPSPLTLPLPPPFVILHLVTHSLSQQKSVLRRGHTTLLRIPYPHDEQNPPREGHGLPPEACPQLQPAAPARRRAAVEGPPHRPRVPPARRPRLRAAAAVPRVLPHVAGPLLAAVGAARRVRRAVAGLRHAGAAPVLRHRRPRGGLLLRQPGGAHRQEEAYAARLPALRRLRLLGLARHPRGRGPPPQPRHRLRHRLRPPGPRGRAPPPRPPLPAAQHHDAEVGRLRRRTRAAAADAAALRAEGLRLRRAAEAEDGGCGRSVAAVGAVPAAALGGTPVAARRGQADDGCARRRRCPGIRPCGSSALRGGQQAEGCRRRRSRSCACSSAPQEDGAPRCRRRRRAATCGGNDDDDGSCSSALRRAERRRVGEGAQEQHAPAPPPPPPSRAPAQPQPPAACGRGGDGAGVAEARRRVASRRRSCACAHRATAGREEARRCGEDAAPSCCRRTCGAEGGAPRTQASGAGAAGRRRHGERAQAGPCRPCQPLCGVQGGAAQGCGGVAPQRAPRGHHSQAVCVADGVRHRRGGGGGGGSCACACGCGGREGAAGAVCPADEHAPHRAAAAAGPEGAVRVGPRRLQERQRQGACEACHGNEANCGRAQQAEDTYAQRESAFRICGWRTTEVEPLIK